MWYLEAGAAAMILASDCAAAVRPLATGHSSSCTSADTPPGATPTVKSQKRIQKAPSAFVVAPQESSCSLFDAAAKTADSVPINALVFGLIWGQVGAARAQTVRASCCACCPHLAAICKT